MILLRGVDHITEDPLVLTSRAGSDGGMTDELAKKDARFLDLALFLTSW